MFPYADDVPVRNHSDINWLILIIMVLMAQVFFFKNPVEFLNTWGFVPDRFFHDCGVFPLLTVFTSMFLHADLFHLATNAWILYIFGDNVEDRFGHAKYLAFYLICGVVATLTQSIMGGSPEKVQIGASGAISGVMAAYMVMFPGANVKTCIGYYVTFASPAWSVMLIWFALQCQYVLLQSSGIGFIQLFFETGNIAYYAHIGGFLCGLLFVKLFDRGEEKPKVFHQTKWQRVR